MLTPDDRAAMRKRCDAATNEPWDWYLRRRSVVIDCKQGVLRVRDDASGLMVPLSPDNPNAVLMGNAPTDLPACLDALDEKDAEIERLRAALEDISQGVYSPQEYSAEKAKAYLEQSADPQQSGPRESATAQKGQP